MQFPHATAAFVAGDGPPARGGEAITGLALALWDGDHSYVADPRRVVESRDLALVVAERAISVVRRGVSGEAMAQGVGGGLCAAMRADLRVEVGDMPLHGARAEVERGGDPAIAVAGSEQP